MTDTTTDFEGLQLLHTDLLALSESRLCNVERLWTQLEARITEFRQLLDRKPQTEQSRKALATGKITILDIEYSVNDQFQQNALQVAANLDLDELAAAQLVLEASGDAESLGRSMTESAIIRFHQTRQYILDCFRMVLEQSNETDGEEEEGPRHRGAFVHVVDAILDGDKVNGGSRAVPKCLRSMTDIKDWVHRISERTNSAVVLGNTQHIADFENLEYQRISLIQQHETLGLILFHLVKAIKSTVDDFQNLLSDIKTIDRYDNLLVHYFPAIGVFISTFGGHEGCSLQASRDLDKSIMETHVSWPLHYMHAAVRVWWLSEYSGRYGEVSGEPSLLSLNVDEENKTRGKQFSEALKDGAFDFLLSLSADVKSSDWIDPARHGLRQWLLRKAPALIPDSISFSDLFQDVLMEQLESFIDAFITNMPDILRKLRIDEDEQRQLSQTHEHDLDLERFLVIISYIFENRADAALSLFWSDPESNLAGFLQWVSKRASTPLMSAFCEMLQSLAGNDECATSTHEFLLDEGPSTSGKIRRNNSLSWSQIFRELKFFTEKIRDVPALPQSNLHRVGKAHHDHSETEPESAMMLESYLRLITQLSTESTTVKDFLLKHQTFHLLDILYQLASSSIPARLRACAFKAIRSLASQKTKEDGEHIWTSLDVWVSGGYSPGSTLPRGSVTAAASFRAMNGIFEQIKSGFEEPNAFVQLLEALVSSNANDNGLDDCLPFPESLGSANRMPGIDPYVDFVMKDVFTAKTSKTNDLTQLRLIRLSCLGFIKTCLSTFNEDLVVFANRSSIAVDGAIRTSDLTTYICLHPFARIMEWIFNEKVMSVLFELIHQNPADIANSAPDSPLVLCLLFTIDVINLSMALQSTYLHIVRPIIKLQPNHRRNNVANAAYASFEDGVLNNLTIFADLGLFTSVGHPVLTITALKLLTALATAPKLVSPPDFGDSRRLGRNKLIVALEADNEADRIARSLLNELTSPTDIALGIDERTFVIKAQILDFLIACLQAVPDRPTIAHLLLGFHCEENTVQIQEGSSFSRRESIFHATFDFVADGLIGDETTGVSGALTSLRSKGFQLLRMLWTSFITSHIVLSELRNNDFLACLVTREIVVDVGTMWNGRVLADAQFRSTQSAETLWQFLASRTAALSYAATEMRHLAIEQSPSVLFSALRTLLGSTMIEDDQRIQHSSVFEFFDFMEINLFDNEPLPVLPHMESLELSVCMRETFPPLYDLKWAEELIALRKADLKNRGHLTTPQDSEAAYDLEARHLMTVMMCKNNMVQFRIARMQTLEAWVSLMLIVTKLGGLTGTNKTEFVLRTLQVISPQLEKATTSSLQEALELSKLAKFVICSIDFCGDAFGQGDMGDLASDRLYELFSVCLRAIHSPMANASLKETLYGICYHYLTGMGDVLKGSRLLRRHSMQTIKVAGEKLLDVVCDDAYAGDQTCRISAILLLSALVDMAVQEDSKYMVESLIRLNSLGLMVDSIKNIVDELGALPAGDVDLQFSYYNAKFALLLRLSQTRYGAGAVLNAGLFSSVRASGLFAADPDLGIDIEDNSSVKKHYQLLLAIMRIINAAVLSRGQQNHQVIAHGRKFISENRLSILSVFKRSVSLGSTDEILAGTLAEDLAEAYMLLITVTDFLDFEGERKPRKHVIMSFT